MTMRQQARPGRGAPASGTGGGGAPRGRIGRALPLAALAAAALALAVATPEDPRAGVGPDAAWLLLPAAHAQQPDSIPPTVVNVTATNGAYVAGRVVNVTVAFDEPVAYSGNPPTLALDVGGENRTASYADGNGTERLVFSYTVRAGDSEDDLGYPGADALDGSVADLAGNAAGLALPQPRGPGSLSNTSDVLIDHAAPQLIASGSARHGTGGFNDLAYATDVAAVAAGNRTYAVVSAYTSNAVQVIRVHENGTLAPAGRLSSATGFADMNQMYGVATIRSGGASYAFAGALASDAVHLFRIYENGTVVSAASPLLNNGDRELDGASRMAAFELNGALHALVAGFYDHGVQLVRFNGSDLEAVDRLSNNDDDLRFSSPFGMDVFDLGTEKHALATAHGHSVVHLIRMHENGTLSVLDSLAAGPDRNLVGPSDVASFDLNGTAHALVASDGSNGIQLIRVNGDGTLDAAGMANGSSNGFAGLSGASGISHISSASTGGAYAVAASPGSGVQLVHVRGGDGALLSAGSAVDGRDGFTRIPGPYAINTFDLGGAAHALVVSNSPGSVQLIRLSAVSVANVTAPDAGGLHGLGENIDIRVAFDGNVSVAEPLELRLNTGGAAAYHSGNGSKTLVFRYAASPGERSTDALDYAGVHALRAGPGGSITEVGTGIHASALLPPPGSPDSLGGSRAIAIDTQTGVESVSSPNGTGVYGLGETIRVRVDFDAAVNVTGAPLLELGTDMAGGINRSAVYESGSGTQNLTFAYTVGAGDRADDLGWAGAGALSGHIADAVTGMAANLDMPDTAGNAPLSASGPILVDYAKPVLIGNGSAVHGSGFSRLEDTSAVAALEADGKQYVLAGRNGIELIRVHENGTMRSVDNVTNTDPGFSYLDGITGIDAFEMGGGTYAITASWTENGVQLVRVHGNNDTLEGKHSLRSIADAWRADAFRMGVDSDADGEDDTYALVGSPGSDTVRLLRVHPNGTMQQVGQAGSIDAFVVSAFGTGDPVRALVASYSDWTVYSLRVHSNGTVVQTGSLVSPGSIRGTSTVAAFGLGSDGTYALVSYHNADAIDLIRVHNNGTMERANRVLHNAPGFASLDQVRGIAPFSVRGADGGTYVLVAAGGLVGSADHGSAQVVRVLGAGDATAGSILPIGTASAAGGDPGFESTGDYQDADIFELSGRTYAALAAKSGNAVVLAKLSLASVASVGSPNATGAYVAGRNIVLNVTFGEPVAFGSDPPRLLLDIGGSPRNATYMSGNATSSLLFNYTVLPADNDGALGYGSTAALSGDLRDLDGRLADPTLPPPGSPLSLSGSSDIVFDTAGPRVLSVTSPNATGTYGINDTIRISVEFDEPLAVDTARGSPTLELYTAGEANRSATHVQSPDGGNSLLFEYTVREGDTSSDLDYTGTSALSLSGAAVADMLGNAWRPETLPAPGGEGSLAATSALAVDGNPPGVASVSSPNASGSYGAGRTILVNVTFDEPVGVSGAPRIALDTGGPGGGAAEYASGSGGASLLFAYTVRAGDSTPGLRYASESALSPGGGIADLAGNAAGLGLPAPGPLPGTGDIVLDTSAPRVANVTSSTPDGEYGTGSRIEVSVNFDERVWHSGDATALSLNVSGSPRDASYASGSGTQSLVFGYTVMSGDMAGDLDYYGTGALSGDIADAAGNAANRTLPPPGSPLSLSGMSALRLDGSRPSAATASAVFTGPNTVRIDYDAPLGPPENHTGPVYGGVSVAGGAEAPASSESGLGMQAHTVEFGGAGAGRDQAGSIRLLADLAGEAGGIKYEFTSDTINVAAGATARTLSPPGAAPVVAIERGGFVRALNATAAGDGARPAINLAGLAGGGASATLPAERVAVIASFAEVSFPPNATAMSVPADGLLELYISERAPTVQEIADGLKVDAADILEVRKIVEVGDNATRIEFSLPVRILLVGQANGTAFYAGGAGGPVVPITRGCGVDDTAAVDDLLNGTGECQLVSADGEDRIIYTYHLTRFGTALVDPGDTCAASLSPAEIRLDSARPGGQSTAAAAQSVVRDGTLPLASVSVNATAWTGEDGAVVMMPASATSVMVAGAWTPLGNDPVDLAVNGGSASAEFRVDVPRDALPAETTSRVEASQALTYTVMCDAPTE